MDAFEQLVAEIFYAEGHWVQTSVKVCLTREEKQRIGRYSSPRWELDVVAYRPAADEILVLECKSFLDSTGVQYAEFLDGHPSTRYKLFREPVLRETVLRRLGKQMAAQGRCRPETTIRLGMVAGKIKGGDDEPLQQLFEENGWRLHTPDWLTDRLRDLAADGYTNQISSVVAKLLLRERLAIRSKSAPGGEPLWERPTVDSKLMLMVKDNPKRPGSQAFSRFQGYFLPEVTTVGAALARGLRWDDIKNDLKKNFIQVTAPEGGND